VISSVFVCLSEELIIWYPSLWRSADAAFLTKSFVGWQFRRCNALPDHRIAGDCKVNTNVFVPLVVVADPSKANPLATNSWINSFNDAKTTSTEGRLFSSMEYNVLLLLLLSLLLPDSLYIPSNRWTIAVPTISWWNCGNRLLLYLSFLQTKALTNLCSTRPVSSSLSSLVGLVGCGCCSSKRSGGFWLISLAMVAYWAKEIKSKDDDWNHLLDSNTYWPLWISPLQMLIPTTIR